jgi:hypothetical protein
MSKFMLDVELWDDENCNGCPHLDNYSNVSCCTYTDLPLEEVEIAQMSGIWVVYKRNKECPLKPIDE